MSSAVSALSMYSHLCNEMSSFSLCAHMGNAACIIFIMWNSISGLEAWYHFRFNISCGVAVTVRSHQEKFQVIFQGDVRGAKKTKKNWRGGPIFIFEVVFIFEVHFVLFYFIFSPECGIAQNSFPIFAS